MLGIKIFNMLYISKTFALIDINTYITNKKNIIFSFSSFPHFKEVFFFFLSVQSCTYFQRYMSNLTNLNYEHLGLDFLFQIRSILKCFRVLVAPFFFFLDMQCIKTYYTRYKYLKT